MVYATSDRIGIFAIPAATVTPFLSNSLAHRTPWKHHRERATAAQNAEQYAAAKEGGPRLLTIRTSLAALLAELFVRSAGGLTRRALIATR